MVFMACVGPANNYTVQKKAGDYTVDITMGKNPPTAGMNSLEIVISDKTAKAVTNAKVLVTASMPAMPGMPAMENKAEAKLDGGKYTAMIDLSIGGSWNMLVRITQDGKTSTAKFTVDAH